MSVKTTGVRSGYATRLGLTAAASILAIAFAAPAAFAQDPAAPAPAADDDTVVITGVRASIQKGLSIKRRSVQVVDSVVAEDIGKLPDNNVVEALQRVPGVQVANRGNGEGSGLFIRGMPDITTTWNGRNIFTASGRQLELQDIPSNLTSRIDVYKTRAADQFEAGLGGQVDVFTRRPLDFKGMEFSVTGRAIYMDPADKINPNLSALVSNRWETGAGDVGALLNVSYASTQYRDENITAGAMFPYVAGPTLPPGSGAANLCIPPNPNGWVLYEKISPADCRAPNLATSDPSDLQQIWQAGSERGLSQAAGSTLRINGVDVPYFLTRDAIIATDLLGDRQRPAVNVALQWRPNADAEYTFEYAYEGYRNQYTQQMFFNFVDSWAPGYSTPVLYDGTNVVKSRSVVNGFAFTSGENTTQRTDTHIFALSGKWNLSDKLRLNADLTVVDSEFDSKFLALRAIAFPSALDIDFNAGDGVPSLNWGNNADAADPSKWFADWFYDNQDRREGSAKTLTLRGVYDTDGGFLKKISFGANFDSREASEFWRDQSGCLCGPALSTYPAGFTRTNEGFFEGEGDFVRSWVVVNGDWLRDNPDVVRAGVKAGNPSFRLGSELTLPMEFQVEENTTAAYVMGDFENTILGRPLYTQVGVRWTSVDTDMAFWDPVANAFVTDAASVSKFLPSLTLRYDATDDIRLRFNYGETLRRPAFTDLNPILRLTDDLSNVGYGSGAGGNPNLEPAYSKNLDIGFEWYFARDSLFSTTFFRREIEGLTVSIPNAVIDTRDGYPNTDLFIVTQPVNASDGVLQGAEFALTYFPKNLPGVLDGFGVQGSLTLLDSSQNIPIANLAGVIVDQAKTDFFGVSDTSYNVTLVYDKGPFDARLSYVWRDDWLRQNEARLFANPLGIWARDEGFLDFQFSYDVSEKLVLTFDATNILEQKAQGYYKFEDVGDPETNNFNTFLVPRTFAVGFRWKM